MHRDRRIYAVIAAVICAAQLGAAADDAPISPEQARFFETKVRPLLADQCLKCHGPDKQKSSLRLDSRAAALTGGDTGPAVVPGKPAESLLVAAIRYDDEVLKMPPSKKLAAEQIGDLTRWVEMGAPWPGGVEAPVASVRKGLFQITDKDRAHWAFQRVRRPVVPTVKDRAWTQNPVDSFILSRLEADNLPPNPPAAKHELIRRLYYDLTGLPPSPLEVAAFLADDSPAAYETLVDRLLASPHYGEKWARHWLDLVRFAETNSYERDNPKPSAWRYRDYVVRAFNQDKPYDRFVREQLAGDELFPRDTDALIATGYYRLGIWDDEPTDREQARYDALDDIVATTGQVFLGLTIDCARCHDHKLDPLPQKDYYKLLAFFQNVNHFRNGGPTDEVAFVESGNEGVVALELAERRRKQTEIQDEIAAIEREFQERVAATRAVEASRSDLDDLHYQFYRDSWDVLPDFAQLKSESSGELPGRFFDLAPRTRDDAFGFVFEGVLIVPEDGRYTFYLDSDDGSRLSVADKMLIEYDGVHELGSELSASIDLPQGQVPIRLDYFQRRDGLGLRVAWSGPSFARRSLSAQEGAKTADLARLLNKDGARVLGPERFDRLQQLKRRRAELRRQGGASSSILCVTEAGRMPRDTFVLMRGNPHVPGDKVDPGFLEVIGTESPEIPQPPPNAKSSGRRSILARWITSADNPLFARVIVNRLWQQLFGRGIVRSPSNFGTQGDKPTHPELLDWLAAELVAHEWRLKPIQRMIVTSNAYRMSSHPRAEALAVDPLNDRFWRHDMRRLAAEEIRDSILAASGDLNGKMYGPGIYPELPAEVLATQSMPGKGWGNTPPYEQARRSVYIHVKRSLLVPILEGFDLAETDRSTPVRFSTTQPTQALGMLNGKFLNQQAAHFAARLRREAGSDHAARVRLAFLLAASREPTPTEITRGVKLMERVASQPASSVEAAENAFALVVLNLNEFLYLD
jgi:hypothetical protein